MEYKKPSLRAIKVSRIINIYQGYLVQRFNIRSSAIGRDCGANTGRKMIKLFIKGYRHIAIKL
ncbi:hypothetical protein, partial [Bacillus toyonensis]